MQENSAPLKGTRRWVRLKDVPTESLVLDFPAADGSIENPIKIVVLMDGKPVFRYAEEEGNGGNRREGGWSARILGPSSAETFSNIIARALEQANVKVAMSDRGIRLVLTELPVASSRETGTVSERLAKFTRPNDDRVFIFGGVGVANAVFGQEAGIAFGRLRSIKIPVGKGKQRKIKTIVTLPVPDMVDPKPPVKGSKGGGTIGMLDVAVEHVSTAIAGRNRYDISDRMPPGVPKYTLVDTVKKFKAFMAILKKSKTPIFDFEGDNLSRISNRLLTMQVCAPSSLEDTDPPCFVLPLRHDESPWTAKEYKFICRQLRDYFENGKLTEYTIWASARYDIGQIIAGFNVRWFDHNVYDVQTAEHLLNENRKFLPKVWFHATKPFSLQALEWHYGYVRSGLAIDKDDRKNMGEKSLKDLGDYGVIDVLSPFYIHKCQRAEAYRVRYKKFMLMAVDQCGSTSKVIARMENVGNLADLEYLQSQALPSSDLNKALAELEETFRSSPAVQKTNRILTDEAGHVSEGLFGKAKRPWVFSIRKPEHRHRLFFDVLKLPPVQVSQKTNKPSTGKKFQDTYKLRVPEVAQLEEYTKQFKLRSAFVDSLLNRFMDDPDTAKDSHIRSSYSTLAVVTGRLSSFNVNLQNIPSRGKLAKIIKRIFIAGKGRVLLKCVDGDTTVATDRGIFAIKDLAKMAEGRGNTKRLSVKIRGKDGAATTTYWKYSGEKPTLKVSTDFGNNIVCTEDHRLLVLDETSGELVWRETSDIAVGDALCLSTKKLTRKSRLPLNLTDFSATNTNNTSGYNGVFCDKRYMRYHGRVICPKTGRKIATSSYDTAEEAYAARCLLAKELNVSEISRSFAALSRPEYMTEDLAYCLGAILSEGYFTFRNSGPKDRGIVSVGNTDKKFLSVINERMTKIFGVSSPLEVASSAAGDTMTINGVSTRSTKQSYNLRYQNRRLSQWMAELGLQSSHDLREDRSSPSWNKTVPDCILQADERSQLAFLAAYLEGDGTVHEGKPRLTWYSYSTKMLNGLRAILNAHGYTPRNTKNGITLGKTDSEHLWPKIQPLMITKSFMSEGEPGRYGTTEGIPISYWANASDLATIKNRATLFDENSETTKTILKSLENAIGTDETNKLRRLMRGGFRFTRVTAIETAGKREVYDISVEKKYAPAFVANGLIAHNCDYSAHEVRVLGIVSRDDAILALFQAAHEAKLALRLAKTPEEFAAAVARFKREGDIHISNVRLMFNQEVDKDHPLRQSIKTAVFGTIYAMGPAALAAQLFTVHETEKNLIKFIKKNVEEQTALNDKIKKANDPDTIAKLKGELPKKIADHRNLVEQLRRKRLTDDEKIQEASDLMNKLFSAWPTASAWMDKLKVTAEKNLTVVSPLGRVRHLSGYLHSEKRVKSAMGRRTANSVIQGMASEQATMSGQLTGKLLWDMFGPEGRTDHKLHNMVHDSQMWSCPIHLLPLMAYFVEHGMTTLMRQHYQTKYKIDIPIPYGIDMEFGLTEGKMHGWNMRADSMLTIGDELLKESGATKKQIAAFRKNAAVVSKIREFELRKYPNGGMSKNGQSAEYWENNIAWAA